MSEPNDDRLRPAGEELPGPDESNRDPGADYDTMGIPDPADDSTTGKGEVPEPEEPLAPTDKPSVALSYGMGERDDEYPSGVEAELAAEEPEEEELSPDDRGGPAESSAMHLQGEEDPELPE